jgi:hypothetical protein
VGEDRDHLIPEAELNDHTGSEHCVCRPIDGQVMPKRQHVWVHGLR